MPWTLRPCQLALEEYRLEQYHLYRLHPCPSLRNKQYNTSAPYAPSNVLLDPTMSAPSSTIIAYMIGRQVHQHEKEAEVTPMTIKP